MKPGLSIGQTATVEATVTQDMYAQFEGQVVHPAYSTVSMVYHMEWAARKIILPYLEEDEEGMGGAVSLKHVDMSPLGSRVYVTATLTEIRDNVIVTRVEARNDYGIIGIGEVKQVVLPKPVIHQKLAMSTFFNNRNESAYLNPF
ncbi:thioesterase family protein [Exiguobacterium flavidum]|uniref:thioesterase family protein n=1 Tax=Exiguobacterium flavidum TaxID=2184695 RepID=UPI000DF76FDB|nr:thioesterase [Exiguobacterium flavidum]